MAPEDCLILPRQESGFLGTKFIAGNGHIKTASTRELRFPMCYSEELSGRAIGKVGRRKRGKCIKGIVSTVVKLLPPNVEN
jgi:hypothetical protein